MRTYNKLVRDKIPHIIRSNGEEPVAHKLPPSLFPYFATKKLDEEVMEFHRDPCVEELVDVVEVALALAEVFGVSEEEFNKLRQQKIEERGAFKDHILLEDVG